jgi:antitoxin component YwqK of YwqJK toxin-antitoxin module
MTGDLHTRSIDCHWQDEVCDIVEYESKDRFYDDRYTKAKYTLRNGKKDGLYQRFDREMIRHKWGDGYSFLSARRESDNEYWDYVCLEESEYKDGKLHGMSRKYNKKLWLESETQYKDGKKHGFEKLYNSDGTVAELKYWQEGNDCTAKYETLKKIATKRIEKEKAVEAQTGKKTRLPKMNKFEKTIAMAKETLGLSK